MNYRNRNTKIDRFRLANSQIKKIDFEVANEYFIPPKNSKLTQIATTKLAEKREQANIKGTSFYPGEMFSINGVEIVNDILKINAHYLPNGYLYHWLTNGCREYYDELQNLRLFESNGFHGLAIGVLPITSDKYLIGGKVKSSAIINKGIHNLCGGNFQPNELGIQYTPDFKINSSSFKQMAIFEMKEELGLEGNENNLFPLVFSYGNDFNQAPVLTYFCKLELNHKELIQRFNNATEQEFAKPVIFNTENNAIKNALESDNLSFSMREALLAYIDKFSKTV